MKSLLEGIPAETRRKTGWILPVLLLVGLRVGLGEPDGPVEAAERYWTGGLALGGCAVGAFWQWYSPRDLVERLYNPAGLVMGFAVLFMLPFDLVDKSTGYFAWFPIGVLAGLVLVAKETKEPKAEQSPGI